MTTNIESVEMPSLPVTTKVRTLPRLITAVALIVALLGTAITVAAPGAAAVTPPSTTPDYAQLQADLNRAQSMWRNGFPDGGTYEMDYRFVCRCSRRGTVTATVESGVGTWIASDGRPTDSWQELTVEGLFEIVQDGIWNRFAALQVTYNELGVPVEIITDPIAAAVDEERTIIVDRFVSETPARDVRAEYEAARTLWNTHFGPDTGATYAMSYQRFCFCPAQYVAEQTTWVHGDTIENWKAVDGTTGQGPEYSMEDLFDIILDELDDSRYVIDVEYDDELGYPTSIVIDGAPNIADDGYRISVNRFSPNDTFARALHDARIMRDNIESPGDAAALTYTRECSIRLWCPEGEDVAAEMQVDVIRQPSSEFAVTGFLPVDSPQPARTYQGAADDFWFGLDWAADLIVNGGDFIEVDVDYRGAGELLFWRSYELTVVPEDSEPQVLSYNLSSIDPYGCCTQTSEIIYAESFDGADPYPGAWVLGDGDTAVTGAFEIGDPEQTVRGRTIVQPEDPSDGLYALVTDPRAGSSAGSHDIDGGWVYATSPVIHIPQRTETELSLDWYFGHAGAFDRQDSFFISIVNADSGDEDVILERRDTYHRNATWASFTANLVQYAGSNIQIRVGASDLGRRSVSEAGIDNVMIRTANSGPAAFWSEDFDPTGDVEVTGNASTGAWAIGAPEATSARGVDLQVGRAAGGAQALITDPRAGYSAGTFDVDGGETTATLKVGMLPLTLVPVSFTLEFESYFAHLANADAEDHLTVTVLGSNGERETVLGIRGSQTNRDAAWTTTRADISRFQGQDVTIVISAADNRRPSLIEAGIDSMRIEMENLALPAQ